MPPRVKYAVFCLDEVSDMPQIKSDEYLYSAARFRAKAAGLPSAEMFTRLAEAKDIDECLRQLSDAGVSIEKDSDGTLMIEQSLDRYLTECFDEVASCLPDNAMVDIFRYPYDAHNVKAILKSRVRGTDPLPLLMSMGTVSPEDAESALRTGNYGQFSPEISASIDKANSLYAQTTDPQLLDAVVDAGCFADMLAKAKAYGGYLVNAVQTRIDSINILTALRILRMGGYESSFYSQHFIPGGKLSEDMMLKAFEEGERAFIKTLARTDYSSLSDKFTGDEQARLSEWESACDGLYRKVIKQSDSLLAGVEVLFAYLADRENEVKKIRVLLTAKQAGLSADRIKDLIGKGGI